MLEKVYRLPAVAATTGLASSTLYDMMGRGEFPRPVKLGRRAVGWPESVLKTWLEERARLTTRGLV